MHDKSASHVRRHLRTAGVALFASATLFAAACSSGSSSSPLSPSAAGISPGGLAASVTPVFVAGNPACQDLGYPFEHKIDPADPGTTVSPVPGLGTITLIVDANDQFFDWSSTFGIDAVIAKGGPNANVYVYDPPAESLGDTDLSAPLNGDQPFGISHVSFCYDINLEVTKTAETTFTRDFDWTIVKTVDEDSLILSPGQTATVNYEIVVTKEAGTDSDWAVSGTIDVHNPHPSLTAMNVVVTDEISGVGAVAVDCGGQTTIAPGATLQCTYGLVALPDGTDRTNTATAAASNIDGGEGTADVIFGDPTTVIDDCVDISDTHPEFAATFGVVNICESQTFEYDVELSAADFECGENLVENTATLHEDDGEDEESTETVTVEVDCPVTGGCTLTIGYWKTHSKYGPAPFDSTWASGLDPSGGAFDEDTTFYFSGQTYYQVLWTSPGGGNAYYILAHQYIATLLNIAAGADPPAGVDLLAIHDFFDDAANTPAAIGALKGNNATRAMLLDWASMLDDYNNGLSNVNHCSE